MPAKANQLFDAMLVDDWSTATNLFTQLQKARSGPPTRSSVFQRASDWVLERLQKIGLYTQRIPPLYGAAWQPLAEAYWAYSLHKTWHKPFLGMVVGDTIAAIPSNSIYFGGTDPGRFAVSAAIDSQIHGRPFFVLSQNQLVDASYLDYLRVMYTNHIYVPTPDVAQQAFQSYLTDAQRRFQSSQLKKGENVQTVSGRVQVSGQVAVMEINALLVKTIFEKNPKREIYIEQSWPLEWTYPHLIPRGPIFKINREPMERLSEDAVQADRAYWSNSCARLVGNWIRPETTLGEVCEFAERVYARNDLTGFSGDPEYLRDKAAQEYFSKLRYAVADVYLWRCSEAKDVAEKERMLVETMLAFQQAFALGPGNYEVVNDFSVMLAEMQRFNDADRVVEVSSTISPTNASLKSLLRGMKAKRQPSP